MESPSESESRFERDSGGVLKPVEVSRVCEASYHVEMGDRLTNTFTKDFLCLDYEDIFGGDHGYTPEIMDGILRTARDLELEVNEDDIEELIMGHEDELTTEELQEIFNEEHQETQRNVSPSEQDENQ
ncbi:hypothetical protein TNCV_4776811 [Trichonephila clavipes]|nr:hypothetical protein TNCV_4776811 [Trichonephila clavipes]